MLSLNIICPMCSAVGWNPERSSQLFSFSHWLRDIDQWAPWFRFVRLYSILHTSLILLRETWATHFLFLHYSNIGLLWLVTEKSNNFQSIEVENCNEHIRDDIILNQQGYFVMPALVLSSNHIVSSFYVSYYHSHIFSSNLDTRSAILRGGEKPFKSHCTVLKTNNVILDTL